MNRKIFLGAGTSHGLNKEMLRNHFPGCKIQCRTDVSFLTFDTVTEAYNLLKLGKKVKINGTFIVMYWAEGSYDPEMLLDQLEREKQKAEKEQAERKASQKVQQLQNAPLAAAVPVGPMQPVTGQYVSLQPQSTGYNTYIGYQGYYEPINQPVGQVMQQPAPIVNFWQKPAQNSVPVVVPTTLVPKPAILPYSSTYLPISQFRQQPGLLPGSSIQTIHFKSGVPGYMQPNVGQQIGPSPGQMIAPYAPQRQLFTQPTGQNVAQRQFLGQQIGQNLPQRQFFGQQTGQNVPQKQYFGEQTGQNSPGGGRQ